eukprot:10281565-Prorocentrum_lima.AAC.1
MSRTGDYPRHRVRGRKSARRALGHTLREPESCRNVAWILCNHLPQSDVGTPSSHLGIGVAPQ